MLRKGIKLEKQQLACCFWMDLWVSGFMVTVLLFTEDHGEIMNYADFNITVSKDMAAPDRLM